MLLQKHPKLNPHQGRKATLPQIPYRVMASWGLVY